jgi:hypothetical protein
VTVSATTDKERAAGELAAAHFEVDPAIQRIFRVVHPDPEARATRR